MRNYIQAPYFTELSKGDGGNNENTIKNSIMKYATNKAKKTYLLSVSGLTILFLVSLSWAVHSQYEHAYSYAESEARASFEKDLVYRQWAASHGGVYVPVADKYPPNPLLAHIPERDIVTPSGRKLTLVNPAYMTRQVFEMAEKEFNVKAHITSLNPLRKENAPDEWEADVLRKFEDSSLLKYSSKEDMQGQQFLRFMKPMMVEQSCIKCHENQGYKVGDIRGGISVSVPYDRYLKLARRNSLRLVYSYSAVYMVTMLLGFIMYRQLIKELSLREQGQLELLGQKKQLQEKNRQVLELNESYKHKNEELNEANRALEEAKERAEESDNLKTEFINNLSHEIRTPLNGILGFSSFLEQDDVSEQKRKLYVSIIQKSGKQLLMIIEDILEIAVLGTNQAQMQVADFYLMQLINDLYHEYHDHAKYASLKFVLSCDKNMDQYILHSDQNLLCKVLRKLLDNAFKYTDNGQVVLGCEVVEGGIKIFVKDSGMGISKTKWKQIFNRFSQEDESVKMKYGGLGLGLSIAKETVELLGGTISVESAKGKGSVFYVNLPVVDEDTEGLQSVQPEPSLKNLSHSILVAEDEELNFEYLKVFFEQQTELDCELIHAKNGVEAVAFCQTEKVDLVLMDLKMPQKDGFEATKDIRQLYPDLPVVALTAYATARDREKALQSGCNFFITKPVNEAVLLTVVKKYLMKNHS